MAGIYLHRLIIREARVFRGKQRKPIRIGRVRRRIRCRARMDLVQILRDRQPVRIHPHVTRAQQRARGDLPLDREIPLSCLRIAEQRIVGLVQRASAKHDHVGWRRRRRKLELRLAGDVVRVSVHHRERVASIIEGHGTERRDCEHAEPGADHRLVIAKWTESDADTRVEVTEIPLSQSLRQMILARRQHVRASAALSQRAGIEGLQKSGVHLLKRRRIRQRLLQRVRN